MDEESIVLSTGETCPLVMGLDTSWDVDDTSVTWDFDALKLFIIPQCQMGAMCHIQVSLVVLIPQYTVLNLG